ncbi:MAG: tetratricopeptide repeat protein [Phototrophicales bacterium]|nr:tetratricopeptide repeat protein [Phototrophicales bacterium]
MYIKRDYSRPMFGKQVKQRRNYAPMMFLFGLIMGAIALFVSSNFDNLQEQTMELLGFAPTPTPLPSDLATLASQLFVAGNRQQAADLFERAITQRPENIDYLYEYGKLMIDMDNPERALELADQILDVNSTDPRGYALKARALVWLRRSADAVPVILAGLDLNRGYESPLYSALARAYTDTGKYEDGAEAGLLSVQADPSSSDARRSYAYSLSWVGSNQEAIAQLEAAVRIDPTNIAAHLELALQYLAQNRDQEAIDLYDRILALQPRNARALLRLCSTYRKIGQFERAIGYCQDAIVADPLSIGAYYQLGILQYNLYQFDEALVAFRSCADIAPDNLDCTYRLGLTYYYVDDCQNGWDVLQDALLMAQSRSDSATVVGYIREGLIAIGQRCPDFGRRDPTLPTATPNFNSEIAPEAIATPSV